MKAKKEKILIDVQDLGASIGIIVADTGFGFSISTETAVFTFSDNKTLWWGNGAGSIFCKRNYENA